MSSKHQMSKILMTILITDESELFVLRKALGLMAEMFENIDEWAKFHKLSDDAVEDIKNEQAPILATLRSRIGDNPR